MDFEAIIEAIRARGSDVTLHDIDGVKHAAIPDGIRLTALDIEKLLPAPKAIRRNAVANDLRGLIAYVNKYKGDTTQLYCEGYQQHEVLARLDDHHPGAPSHVQHTVRYSCPAAAEWITWINANDTAFGQAAFAEFLEENVRDVIQPEASEMIKMVENFRDVKAADFQSIVNRTNGRVTFHYVEKDSNAGKVQLPETFTIAIPVFEGFTETAEGAKRPQAVRYSLKARLRWRIVSQELKLFFALDRPDITLRTAYDDLIEHVETHTGISVIRAR